MVGDREVIIADFSVLSIMCFDELGDTSARVVHLPVEA
jgi:hypothetical protein